MLKCMGRENGEDYNSDFTIMLETWEAALDHGAMGHGTSNTAIAKLLGWTRSESRSSENSKPVEAMNATAEACAAAAELIASGVLKRRDFKGVSVKTAREVGRKPQQQTGRAARGSAT